jgi:serine/threonine protein kinase/WD40 repeat protein
LNEPSQSLEEFLFEAALGKSSAAERAAFLDGVCRDNPTLRARLDILLEGHFQAEGFLTAGPKKTEEKPAPPPAEEEAASRFIGRYKLLEKIGEGGFGEVWMAEQKEPVRRRVALKVIKLGMDTMQVVARFEAERQALAMMDHPNIARVFDGGATASGRPYFVMELVRGVRITEYCDQHQLPTHERLKLFIQVCLAIQHAHQKGIIHRDIKPSNILVTLNDGVPEPKVIDFGIAKATQVELTEKTVATQFHQFIGTPAYVSPEQAGMGSLDVDTRSDIYALGVLLYELLTGATPFDTQELLKAGLDGMRQIIRERRPLRPSTRLSRNLLSASANDAAESKIKNQKSKIAGDLDWIVMKCLEKDRGRRYETANGLARDIERHLSNEPVLARPPSTIYGFQKTVRRHWVGFSAIAAILATLAVGLVVSTLEAIRARQAEQGQSRQRIAAQQARADEANQKAAVQQELYKSLVAQARAIRLLRQTGYRDQVFDLLKQAEVLDVPRKNLADLRREAMDCMGDPAGQTPITLTDFATNIVTACLSPSGKLAAFVLGPSKSTPGFGPIVWTIEQRELPSGRRVASFGITNGFFQSLCFNRKGDELFAKCGPPFAQIHRWICDSTGIWREAEINWHPPPVRAANLLSTADGVFVANVSLPFGSYTGRVTFGSEPQLEFDSSDPAHAQSVNVTFGLLDARTGEPVSGHNATNASPSNGWLDYTYSRDGRILAVETHERHEPINIVAFYDWETGQCVNRLYLTNVDYGFSLGDDGKRLAGEWDSVCTVFNLPGLGIARQIKVNYTWASNSDLFSGDRVFRKRQDQNLIDVWDVVTGEELAVLEDSEPTRPVDYSAEGTLLTITGNRARIYHLNVPEKLVLAPHAGAVPGIAFSPDGLRLASAGKDRVLRVYDAQTGRILWETNDLGGPGQCVGYSPDGRWLATGNWDSEAVTVRDASTGRRLLTLGTNGLGEIWSTQFSPDGRYFAAAGPNKNGVKIWAIEPGKRDDPNAAFGAKLIKTCDGGIALLFAPDSKSVTFCGPYTNANGLFADYRRTLCSWDFEQSAQPRRIASGVVGSCACENFLPDGKRLLAMDTNHDIVVIDAASGQRISSCRTESCRTEDSQIIDIPGAPVSPNGLMIAATISTASGTGVDILDANTGKVIYSLPAEAGSIFGVAWSPDSRRLAVSRKDGNIAIWNLQTIDQILAQLHLGS